MHQEFADYFCLFWFVLFGWLLREMLFLHEMDLLLRRCQTNFCHLFFGLLDSSFTLILHASLVDCYLRGWWRGWWFWFLLSPSRGVFCRWRICWAAMWRGDEEGVAVGHVFLWLVQGLHRLKQAFAESSPERLKIGGALLQIGVFSSGLNFCNL